MNVEDPNDPKFDLIRRALALKRHEIPPPRYFNELPGKILSRLAEANSSEPISFFEKIRQTFVLRPILATGAGMAAGVFALGLVAITLLPTGNDMPANPVALVPAAADLNQLRPEIPGQPLNAMAELIQASTNSPTDQPKSIFDSFRIETAPVSVPLQPR